MMMNRGTRPDICIYHASCLDGFAAAWAVWQRWPDVVFLPQHYGDKPAEAYDLADLDVLIVDFSYPEAGLREMAAAARSVTVLDHHEGAREHLTRLLEEKVIGGYFTLEHSGAAITWAHTWGTLTPRLIEFVEDRDLWRFRLAETKAVTALLGSHPYDFEVWTEIGRQLEDPFARKAVVSEGAAILRDRNNNLRELLAATKREMILGDWVIPVANVPYYMASEAGHLLCEANPEAPFAATYFDLSDGRRKFSLRSGPDGADVNAVAKLFGGGGHEHAAGFTIDRAWDNEVGSESAVVAEAPHEDED